MPRLGLGLGLGVGRPPPASGGSGTTYDRTASVALVGSLAGSANRDRVRTATIAETMAVSADRIRERGRTATVSETMAVSADRIRERGRTDTVAQALSLTATASKETWDPTYVSGCQLWLDPTYDAGIWQDSARTTPSTGTQVVGCIDDRSGQGRNHTQGTAANKPTRSTVGANSLGALLGDGSNDNVNNTGTWATGAKTVGIVFEPAALPGSVGILFSLRDSTLATCTIVSLRTAAGSTYVEFGADGLATLTQRRFTTTTLATSTRYVVILTYDGVSNTANSSYTCEINTTSQTVGAGANIVTGTQYGSLLAQNGGAAPYSGKVGAAVVYNSVLSATDIGRLRTYLNRWA